MTALDQDIGAFPVGMAVAKTGKDVVGTGIASFADGGVSSCRDTLPSPMAKLTPTATWVPLSGARPIGPMT